MDIVYGLDTESKVEDQFLKMSSISVTWDNQDLTGK